MSPKEEIQFFISYLYLKHPFYNSLISEMNIELETTELSEKYKVYSPSFLNIRIDENFAKDLIDNDKKKLLFYYLIHEILHIILNHPQRKLGRIDGKWDKAADIVVDNVIKKDDILYNLIQIPKEAEGINEIYDFEKKVSESVEDIYNRLREKEDNENQEDSSKEKSDSENGDSSDSKCENNTGNKDNENLKNDDSKKVSEEEGKGNDSKKGNSNSKTSKSHLNNHNQWNEQNSNKSKEINKTQELIMKAVEFAKLKESDKEFGGSPGCFIEEIKDLLTPKTDLKSYLNKIVQSFKKEKNTYKRGDRRYLYNNLIVPSKVKDIKHFKLLFFIDTSGSMDIDDLQQSMSDIIDVVKSLKSFNIEIIHSDVDISNKLVINENSDINIPEMLKIYGRGGTELTPLFDYLEEKDKNNETFDAVIVNTDFHIMKDELLIYIEKEPIYNFLALIPKDFKKSYVEQIENKFFI